MDIITFLLLAWVPEVYFAATDLIQAMAWGVVAILSTILAIYSTTQDNKKSASRGND